MSNISYPYPSPATLPPARPVVVSVLAIIGIVFGSLGVLCGGMGLLSAVAMSVVKTPVAPRVSAQPIQIGLAILGFLLSGLLLFASIGSLSLKPQARKMMVGWSLADVLYNTAKFAITLIFVLPMTTQMLAANNPAGASMARMMLIISGVAVWLFTVAYAVIVWFVFQSKDIVAAFERSSIGFDPIIQPMSPPPPPIGLA